MSVAQLYRLSVNRLKGGLDDLQTIVAHLNWRKSSPFAVLRGTLYPQGLSAENLQGLASLSFHSDVSYEDMLRSRFLSAPPGPGTLRKARRVPWVLPG